MRAAGAVSTHPVAATATGEVVGQILESGLDPPDLMCCFVTSAHAGALEDIAAALVTLLQPGVLLGAAAAGVAATDTVIDEGPGLVLWAASGFSVAPLRFPPGAPWSIPADARGAILLADPQAADEGWSARTEDWSRSQIPVAGALVAPPRAAGGTVLALDGQLQRTGAVGVAIGTGAGLRAEVCPGARPVGPPLTVTQSGGPMIYRLDGVAARDRLERMARDELPVSDIPFINRGLALGVAGDRGVDIYPVAGSDPGNGAIALGADGPDWSVEVPAEASVRFYVRDPVAEAAELHRAIAAPAETGPPCAALVFPSRSSLPVRSPVPVAGCRAVAALSGGSGTNGASVHQASAAVACFYDITSLSGGQQVTVR